MAERILFVTGRLAEPLLRKTLDDIGRSRVEASICVMKISVAALMTPDWIARQLQALNQSSGGVAPKEIEPRSSGDSANRSTLMWDVEKVVLPGWCQGNLERLREVCGVPVLLGPKDLRELGKFLGHETAPRGSYGAHDLQIIAEINHCPRLSWEEIEAQACCYATAGADLIDLGCLPGVRWPAVGEITRRLRELGFRISIDSFDPWEVQQAIDNGAELVLSVNQTNVAAASDWDAEVVCIPADTANWQEMETTMESLQSNGIRYRIDPIIEPIGFGFAGSLGRYLAARERWPHEQVMMGIGNVTELVDADSCAINVLLAGFCQELGIRSVLTTEVIPWARSSVRELDLARRLMFYAQQNNCLPKHVESQLILLRDAKFPQLGREFLRQLAEQLRDPNFRIFADEGLIHVMNNQSHVSGVDPVDIFQKIAGENAISSDHAFYLGYEIHKAITALTLNKEYCQDEPLNWGFLTRPEPSHRKNSEP